MRASVQSPLLHIQNPFAPFLGRLLRVVLDMQPDGSEPFRDVGNGVQRQGRDGRDEMRKGRGEQEGLRKRYYGEEAERALA